MEIISFEQQERGTMVTIYMKDMPQDTRSAQVTVRVNGAYKEGQGSPRRTRRSSFHPPATLGLAP